MALNAYLKLKGQKQGDIKGSVTQKGRVGTIMVIAASHDFTSPTDPVSGLPTGKRMHRPFVITKEIDRSSPLLANALTHNETLTDFELQFYQPVLSGSGVGSERNHYTIRLINARVVAIRFRMLNNKHPDLMKFAEYEEIEFAYQQINWTWVDGGITAMDDWESPL